MASRLQVAPAEYLSMSFDGPDREFVRGEIVERPMPTYSQGKTQARLAGRFLPLTQSHRLYPCSEIRMLLAEDLYRVADVAVFAGSEPEEVPAHPPLVVIEIISPDDRYAELQEKLADYEQWGVPNIWVVDPLRRSFSTYHSGSLVVTPRLTLSGYPLEIGRDLFS